VTEIEALKKRYHAAAHAMQTGVGYVIEIEEKKEKPKVCLSRRRARNICASASTPHFATPRLSVRFSSKKASSQNLNTTPQSLRKWSEKRRVTRIASENGSGIPISSSYELEMTDSDDRATFWKGFRALATRVSLGKLITREPSDEEKRQWIEKQKAAAIKSLETKSQ